MANEARQGNSAARESRKHREELTKQASADIMRTRIVGRRFRQTSVARESSISRTHLRSLLRAEKQMSLFIFLELSEALSFDDSCQLLRDVLNRRDQLLAENTQGDMAR